MKMLIQGCPNDLDSRSGQFRCVTSIRGRRQDGYVYIPCLGKFLGKVVHTREPGAKGRDRDSVVDDQKAEGRPEHPEHRSGNGRRITRIGCLSSSNLFRPPGKQERSVPLDKEALIRARRTLGL